MSTNRTVLATAFFDGQPTRKPVQSFSSSGVTGTTGDKDDFLRQLHEERQKREGERRRTKAANTIQKFWRHHRCRQRVKGQLRQEFDINAKQQQTSALFITQQMRRLLLFFLEEIDGDRLVLLCQMIVKSVGSGDRYPTSLMQQFLVRCLRYLQYAVAKGQGVSIAMPFRCLEVIILDDRDATDEEKWSKLVVIGGLVKQGYYECLRSLFDYRTPSSDLLEDQTKAPTVQAESFMKVAVRPLLLLHESSNRFQNKQEQANQIESAIWKSFITNFLSKSPMTPIIRFYVLPHMATLTDVFTLDELARYASAPGSGCLTPEFAYTLAYFMTKRNPATLGLGFISVYAKASESLLELIPRHVCHGDDDDDNYDGASEPMETDDDGNRWVLGQWLNLNHHEKVIVYWAHVVDVDGPGNDDEALTALMGLCRVHWSAEHDGGNRCSFLKMLAYQPKLIQRLWDTIINCTAPSIMGAPIPLIEQLQKGCHISNEDRRRLVPLLSVFCALFSTTLAAANDDDFFQDLNLKPRSSAVPFSRPLLASLSSRLRDTALGLIELALPDSRPTVSGEYRAALSTMGVDFSRHDTREWNQLFEVVVRLLQLLHDRDERLQFCPVGSWSVRNRVTFQHMGSFRSDNPHARRQRRLFHIPRYLSREQLEEAGGFLQSPAELRNMTIMRKIPFVVPFEQRVELLYQLINTDQHEHGREGLWQQGFTVNARRNFLYEDALDQLSKENIPNLRQVIRVRLQNWAGAVEAGVDGGGLFREFLNELLKTGFDPQRGFFVATAHDSTLYPNPLAPRLFPDEEYRRHYFFLGRIVAKLIYENQLAELRFSRFFLSELLRSDISVDVHHLSYYDPVLYRNLIRLKNETDVSSLGLDFSVVVEEVGEVRRFDLKPNGSNILVTNANRLEFIQLMAEFYLHRQIKGQADAFRAGLADLIDLDWLQMFDYRELQVLISGADREIDVDDLKNYTSYCGDVQKEGGEIVDPYIDQFWNVVRSFNEEQKRKLLKFVTSCSRPPLLGFKDLHPAFCIQTYSLRAGEQDRLPTAATCSNLLKLPRFADLRQLKDKLLYAIESGAGFELS